MEICPFCGESLHRLDELYIQEKEVLGCSCCIEAKRLDELEEEGPEGRE